MTRLATVGKTEVNKVYDPACGSGSLLLKAAKILGKEHIRQGFFGQEINITTYNLCRINMFLHDIGPDKFDIAHGDTLTEPAHWDDEPFEVIVSNPPYSIPWKGATTRSSSTTRAIRRRASLRPNRRQILPSSCTRSLGWQATARRRSSCFPGIMYRGGAEQKIRKYLVDNNKIDCIIQLPANLFSGRPFPPASWC